MLSACPSRLAALCVLFAAAVFADDPAPAKDLDGVPLPAGAVARMGHAATKSDCAVDSVAFSKDGKLLLSGSEDGRAHLWTVATGKEVRPFVGHTGWVYAAAFSPDEKSIVTASVFVNRSIIFANTANRRVTATNSHLKPNQTNRGQIFISRPQVRILRLSKRWIKKWSA